MTHKLIAALVAVFLLSALGTTASAKVDDPEGRAAAAKQRIERVSETLNQNRTELDAAQEQSAAAAARETEMAGLLATGAERSAELEGRLGDSRERLAESRRRLKRAERRLADRLVAMYMAGTPDLIDLALGAEGFSELASQREYLVAIQNSDESLAERVDSIRGDLKDQTEKLSLAKAKVDDHNTELASAQAGITAARADAEATAAQLASVQASREGEISSLKGDISAWEKQIAKEQAAAAQIAESTAPEASPEEEVEQQLGGPYSIPTYIVMCESGGNYSALNASSGAGGAYQIMPATWAAYGGKGLPHEASKAEQDRIAALIYADSGTTPWVCG